MYSHQSVHDENCCMLCCAAFPKSRRTLFSTKLAGHCRCHARTGTFCACQISCDNSTMACCFVSKESCCVMWRMLLEKRALQAALLCTFTPLALLNAPDAHPVFYWDAQRAITQLRLHSRCEDTVPLTPCRQDAQQVPSRYLQGRTVGNAPPIPGTPLVPQKDISVADHLLLRMQSRRHPRRNLAEE